MQIAQAMDKAIAVVAPKEIQVPVCLSLCVAAVSYLACYACTLLRFTFCIVYCECLCLVGKGGST